MTKSAVWGIILLHLLLYVLGQLEAPQNVNLISENFSYIVTWKPGAGSPPDTRYTVEACNLHSAKGKFTPVKKCTNITALSCNLSLRFKSSSSIYWVRVKSVTNQSESSWVESNELLPNRDTILGPPIINVKSNIQTIEITLDMPLTPHKQGDNDKPKTLMDIDPHLIYIVVLVDKNGKEYTNAKVRPDKLGKGYYLFENLKPNFTYCVVARFESLFIFHMKDSKEICTTTSPQNTDILWIAPLIAMAIFIVGLTATVFAIWMLKEFTHLHLVQSQLPKSLVIISQDLHVNLQCQDLDENPEDDHISFITNNDHSNEYYQKSQRIDLDTSFIDDMGENVFYQSNGLNCESYECNSLLKGRSGCTDSDNEGLPSSLQASTENRSCASFTQNISLGVPTTSYLQYQLFSNARDTEETSSNNPAEDIPAPDIVHHHFGTVQEIKIESSEIEFWNCADVPLNSVKLSINDNNKKDNLEVDWYADGMSDQLKADDLCSPFTSHFTAPINPPPNGIQGYQAKSVKLPQFEDDCKFQHLIQTPCSHISEPKWMQFSEYEAH